MALAEEELSRPLPSDPGNHPLFVTKEQYYELAERGWFEGKRVELIDGIIYEKISPMSALHAGVIAVVTELFSDIFRPEHTIAVQLPINASQSSEPEPDSAVYAGKAREYMTAKATTALLVVEVALSSITVDRRKASLYARAGIPEYWIINLDGDTLEVFRQPSGERESPDAGNYIETFTLHRGETISPLAAPTTVIKVDNLLP